jgi:hypothetical protein
MVVTTPLQKLRVRDCSHPSIEEKRSNAGEMSERKRFGGSRTLRQTPAAGAALLFALGATSLFAAGIVRAKSRPGGALRAQQSESQAQQNKPPAQPPATQTGQNPSEKAKQGIVASVVAGKTPAPPPETPEALLEAEELARRVPEKTKEAIMASLNASNSPTADDKLGGFHEESGVAGETVTGKWINSPDEPSPYFNPAINRDAISEETPADQQLRNTIARPEIFWHVHPAGIVTVGKFRYMWSQAPSAIDLAGAAPGAIDIVVGARDDTVYFYERSGRVLTLDLQDFMNQTGSK